jgi:protein SCO1/2
MNQKILLFAAGSMVLAMAATLAAESGTNAVRASCCASAERAAGPLTDKSLYQLDSTWTNDNGLPVKLSALCGRPQLVCMFFAHCQYACPLLVQQMKQIEAALPENLRTNVGFVLVSFDTERDTPDALHQYRLQHDLAAERWTLLHGSNDDVLELAALLGVKFKKDAQGQFMHSNVLTILNSQGEITFQETGLNPSTERMAEKLTERALRPPALSRPQSARP